jgi:hypothetical protein
MEKTQGVIGQAEAHHMVKAAPADTAWNGELDEIELKTPSGLLPGTLISAQAAPSLDRNQTLSIILLYRRNWVTKVSVSHFQRPIACLCGPTGKVLCHVSRMILVLLQRTARKRHIAGNAAD